MTVVVRLWGEQTWASSHSDWESCLANLRDQIRQALNAENITHDVKTVTSTNPSAPNPTDLYDSQNSQFWDSYLDNNNAYAEDSSVLVMEDKGGATFSSGLNPSTTTDGCMTLVGGQDLSGSASIDLRGASEHYHDVYNELHELSHALDAPTGSKAIGTYVQDLDGYYHRSPCQTMFDTTNQCGHYNPPNVGNKYWDLEYACGGSYLTDQSA